MDIQNQIEKFIISQSKKFTIDEVKQALLKDNAGSVRDLEDYLEESPYLFILKNKGTDKEYIPRSSFFNKAEFIITPTKLEIEKGILFSGHRFIPFYPQSLFPTESFRMETEKGYLVKTKTIKFKLEDLYNYYALLGAENIIDNLIADHQSNQKIIGNPAQKIDITVFDFSELYKDKNFKEGTSLKFTVKDWNKGKFVVSTMANECDEEAKDKWFETLEEGLFKMFEEKGPYLEIPEQLALGYYASGSSILKSPPCPIEEFIRTNEKIQIKFFENNTIIWKAIEETSSEQEKGLLSISNGTIESLDGILEELGLNIITSTEIEAFMRDSLFEGSNDLPSIIQKFFPDMGVLFKDKAQETAYYNHLEELWEEIAATYQQETNDKITSSRRQILDFLEIFYGWYNDIKAQKTEKSTDSEMAVVYKDALRIREILAMLNNSKSDIGEEEFDQLNGIVFNHLKSIKESIAIINDIVK